MRTYVKVYSDELAHHGIKGMKWGVRRYQNSDGSLTAAGRKRYSDSDGSLSAIGKMRQNSYENKLNRNIRRQTIEDNKLLDTRSKNRSTMESKYDKKIAKANAKAGKSEKAAAKAEKLAKKKQDVLNDFDEGTKAIKKAQQIKNENYNKILELKAKAVSDPSIKESKSYKEAKSWYKSQLASDLYYGKSMTLLGESAAVMNGQSWTRKVLND